MDIVYELSPEQATMLRIAYQDILSQQQVLREARRELAQAEAIVAERQQRVELATLGYRRLLKSILGEDVEGQLKVDFEKGCVFREEQQP